MAAGLPKRAVFYSAVSAFRCETALVIEGGEIDERHWSDNGEALDGAWTRHEILATNVANAETPGYKRLDYDFRGQLERELSKVASPVATNARHLSSASNTRTFAQQDLSNLTADGNSVDIDKEMAEVATNTLYYEAVSGSCHLSWVFYEKR
jgi:flagellar basal-body rod protein FlgB